MIINRILWLFRRVSITIKKEALVLEVGSGGNPYPRSNILLDAYEETRERHWEPLINDRPTVLSFGENLPFKDKVFDFVIAAHVLEHSKYPDKFLNELQRVAKAGYIETPDAFMERINPYKDHHLEITVRNNTLVINKKSKWKLDENIVELYENKVKPILINKLIKNFPSYFHVRYWWNEKIDYLVLNPEVDTEWSINDQSSEVSYYKLNLREKLRQFYLNFLRYIFSQRKRNKNIDIISLLRCPVCHNDIIKIDKNTIKCKSSTCNLFFKTENNIFNIIN